MSPLLHHVAAPPELDPSRVPAGAMAVLRRLRAAGHQAYFAGGAVRDLLLGRPTADWDVATSARPTEVLALFSGAIRTGIEHGTVTVAQEGAPGVEVTTFRGEGPYLDGRRPSSVTFLDDVVEDLARRDFTINAMAWDPEANALCDPFGGLADLARRRIVAVGDPHARFGEDGLRPLRAVRFASVLGFAIERHTRAAIAGALHVYAAVAIERVRDEMEKILVGPHPARGMDLMRLLGLLARPVPELLESVGFRQNRWHRWDVWKHTLVALDQARPELLVRLAVLLHDVAKPRCAREIAPGEHTFYDHELVGAELARQIVLRLRWPVHLANRVAHLVREHNWYYRPEWNAGTVRRHLARVGEENLDALWELRRADLVARGRAVAEGLSNLAELVARFNEVIEEKSALRISDLAIGGREVMQTLGIGPGPRVGEVLRALLEKVLDDPSLNTREGLLELVREFQPTGGVAGG